MMTSLVAFGLGATVLWWLPLHYALMIDCALFVSLVWWGWWRQHLHLSHIVLAVTNIILAVAYYYFGQQGVLPFIGVIIYSVLGGIALLRMSHALYHHTIVLHDLLEHSYHAILALGCAGLSLLLMPQWGFVLYPLLIYAIGVALHKHVVRTLFWTFRVCAQWQERRRNRWHCIPSSIRARAGWMVHYHGFITKAVTTAEEHDVHIQLLRRVYRQVYVENGVSRRLDESALEQYLHEGSDETSTDFLLYSLHTGEPCATYRLFMRSAKPLPIEEELRIRLADFFPPSIEYVEIGRLILDPAFREQGRAMRALLSGLGAWCFARGTSVVVGQAIPSTKVMYEKLGMLPLLNETRTDPLGIVCHPMYLNIAHFLLHGGSERLGLKVTESNDLRKLLHRVYRFRIRHHVINNVPIHARRELV